MAAKGFTLPQMFGQLTDLVSQGFSSPEDILSIGSTGQPDTSDPYGGSEEAFQRGQGDIYGEVLKATGDPTLASQAASGSASDALVQAMMTDQTPSASQIRLDQAVNDVLPMYGQEAFYDKTIDEFANAYGVKSNTLNREVERVKREEEINSRNWWDGKDGIQLPMMDIVQPSIVETIDPARTVSAINAPLSSDEQNALYGILGETADTSVANTTTSMFPQPFQTADQTPDQKRDDFLAANPGMQQEFLKAGFPHPSWQQIQDFLSGVGKYFIQPEVQAQAPIFAAMYPEAVDEDLDQLSQTITKQLAEPEAGAVSDKVTGIPSVPTVPVPQVAAEIPPVGTPIEKGGEGYTNILQKIRRGDMDFGGSPMGEMGTRLWLDRADKKMYRQSGENMIDLFFLGDITLLNDPSSDLQRWQNDDTKEIWNYNENLKWSQPFSREQDKAVASASTGEYNMGEPSTLTGKPWESQWDALRYRQMGADAFNPVLWGARRQGLKQATGQYMLSGSTTPFHEWAPTRPDLDTSELWDSLVDTSRFAMGEDVKPLTGDNEWKRQQLAGFMQGSGARTAILNMTATAMGAKEGIGSEGLRRYLGTLYDLYAAQQGAKGLPTAGFPSWIEDQRTKTEQADILAAGT